MKTLQAVALLTSLALAPVWAQAAPLASAAQPQGNNASAAANKAALTLGEVKKIDLKAQQITLQHGEIKNLGMPPMTMVFLVRDQSLLTKLKVGDKLRFRAEEGSAGLVLSYAEKAAP
jgi:Cu/Ag efflux protein CusF